MPRKRTQPWTDCLGHKSSMDIASVISFFLATALLALKKNETITL